MKKIYLAGKMRRNDTVVGGDGGCMYMDRFGLVPTIPNKKETFEINGEVFEYVGPTTAGFAHWDRDVPCGHNTSAPMGFEGNCGSYEYLCEGSSIFYRCMNGIQKCDIFFAWIDGFDIYGTLVEIGYAHALKKHILLGYCEQFVSEELKVQPFPPPYHEYEAKFKEYWTDDELKLKELRHELWFADKTANDVEVADTPKSALEILLEH